MTKKIKGDDTLLFLKEKERILKLGHKLDKEKHEMKMEEIKFMRESDRLHHERELEKQRVKSAEIRKTQMRRIN